MADNACTTLAVLDAQDILTELVEINDELDRCDNCLKSFNNESCYLVCNFPEQRFRVSENHRGHTCCAECVSSRSYVAEGGSCKPCVMALSNLTRMKKIQHAGIALVPAVENRLAHRYLDAMQTTQTRIDECRERQEMGRIQEGADRRETAKRDVLRRTIERRLVAEARRDDETREAAEMSRTSLARERARDIVRARIETELVREATEQDRRQIEESAMQAHRLLIEAVLRREAEAEDERLSRQAHANAAEVEAIQRATAAEAVQSELRAELEEEQGRKNLLVERCVSLERKLEETHAAPEVLDAEPEAEPEVLEAEREAEPEVLEAEPEPEVLDAEPEASLAPEPDSEASRERPRRRCTQTPAETEATAPEPPRGRKRVCSSTAESRAKRAQNDRAKKERVRRKLEAFDELQRERDELLERVEEQETMEEEVFNLQRQIETITSVAEEMICECGGNAKDFHERVAAAFMQP